MKVDRRIHPVCQWSLRGRCKALPDLTQPRGVRLEQKAFLLVSPPRRVPPGRPRACCVAGPPLALPSPGALGGPLFFPSFPPFSPSWESRAWVSLTGDSRRRFGSSHSLAKTAFEHVLHKQSLREQLVPTQPDRTRTPSNNSQSCWRGSGAVLNRSPVLYQRSFQEKQQTQECRPR